MSKNLVSIHLEHCPDFIVASLCGFCFKACEKPLSPSAVEAAEKPEDARRFTFHKNTLAMCIPVAKELLRMLKGCLEDALAKSGDNFDSQLCVQIYRPLIAALERELDFSSRGCFFPGTTVNFIARGDWSTTSRASTAAPAPTFTQKDREKEISDDESDGDSIWSGKLPPKKAAPKKPASLRVHAKDWDDVSE